MEIKISTEETDIEELKQALDIIKRAINKRDNTVQTELPKEILPPVQKEEIKEPEKYEEPMVEQEPERVIEQPKPFVQPMQIEQPKRIPPPTVDMSALTMSDKGRRPMSSPNSSMRPSSPSSFSQPSLQQPKINEKDAVMEIINNLKRKSPDGPLYMQNIVSLANSRGISEERTRRLVSELKDSGSI